VSNKRDRKDLIMSRPNRGYCAIKNIILTSEYKFHIQYDFIQTEEWDRNLESLGK